MKRFLSSFQSGGWHFEQPERFDAEKRAMQARFPGFQGFDQRMGERTVPGFRGNLQPLNIDSDVGLVAAHLEGRLPLRVGPTGLLIPTTEIIPIQIQPAPQLYRPYTVEVVMPDPPHTPFVVVKRPLITHLIFPDHPHLLTTQFELLRGVYRPRNLACPYAPHDGVWEWEKNSIVQVVEWTALWLANHILWVQLGRTPETWLGPQASHDPQTLINETSPRAPCRCGSGRQYRYCCRPKDLADLKSQPRRFSASGGIQAYDHR